MSQEWLIEALAEIKAYAEAEELKGLAEELELAIQIAHLELAQRHSDKQRPAPD
ncbi:MAG: hypothetical protein ACXIU7_02660 [Roseinatronobacter sp.]